MLLGSPAFVAIIPRHTAQTLHWAHLGSEHLDKEVQLQTPQCDLDEELALAVLEQAKTRTGK